MQARFVKKQYPLLCQLKYVENTLQIYAEEHGYFFRVEMEATNRTNCLEFIELTEKRIEQKTVSAKTLQHKDTGYDFQVLFRLLLIQMFCCLISYYAKYNF